MRWGDIFWPKTTGCGPPSGGMLAWQWLNLIRPPAPQSVGRLFKCTVTKKLLREKLQEVTSSKWCPLEAFSPSSSDDRSRSFRTKACFKRDYELWWFAIFQRWWDESCRSVLKMILVEDSVVKSIANHEVPGGIRLVRMRSGLHSVGFLRKRFSFEFKEYFHTCRPTKK